MIELDDVNTAAQTAEYLKITEDTLRRLVYARKIGSLKQGRQLTFPRAAVEAYVEENTVAANKANPFGLTDASLRKVSASRKQRRTA